MVNHKLEKENNEIEKIFKNLQENILKSPNDMEKHIKHAKKNIECLIRTKNYNIFSDILEQIKPVTLAI
jgi:molecular chaperone GrpE (heat shock protein)